MANLNDSLLPVLVVSPRKEEDLVLRLARENKWLADDVRVLEARTNTIWVRDYGPVFVYGANGTLAVIDPNYGKLLRGKDNAVPPAVAAEFDVPIIETPLLWQGGNLLSNGRGLLVTTTQSINANIEVGNDADTVARFLVERLGSRQIVVLEHLRGERTGHADMFACFTSPETVLVGKYSQSVDPRNAAVLDRNAALLAKVRVGSERLKVIRIPMPTNRDGVFRTYTNVIFANGTLLVPTYPGIDQSAQGRAMGLYHRLLSGWNVVGVDARDLIRQQGGLRCISIYVPLRSPPNLAVPEEHRRQPSGEARRSGAEE